MRKIIQIASHGGSVLALCDDGTVWELIRGPSAYSEADIWRKLPPVPQDEGQSG
jgi:hypothetical protein